jgi:hypothetical protein
MPANTFAQAARRAVINPNGSETTFIIISDITMHSSHDSMPSWHSPMQGNHCFLRATWEVRARQLC